MDEKQPPAAERRMMGCASSRRMHQVPAVPLGVGADNVTHVSSVRDFGVYLDSDASMTTHIPRTAARKLFRHPAPAAERPEVVASSCCCVGRHQSCADEARLL